MNLSQLRFACAVARAGSFTAAAAECCVTQPTLSNAIAQLEQELGVRLFERTTRRVGLTAHGEKLLPAMEEVLRAQQSLTRQARELLGPARETIRIGTSPLVRPALLGRIVEPFRMAHPDVDVVLSEMNMSDLYRLLDETQFDVVIGVAGQQRGTWTTATLYREPLLYVPRGGPSMERSSVEGVRLSDISDETFVMVPDTCGLARATRELFRAHRRKLIEYSGEAMSYQVLQDWALLGIAAAILPRSSITTSDVALPIVDKAGQPAMIEFEAAWRRDDVREGAWQRFREHLMSAAVEAVPGAR
ncbi:LysR family transcriptional regulator [Nitrogeniibacter aestuarii]|uniref:LysR family transcriptional regulator n=1 Tax=Nitrogeniibacter aestuarii TaxID=2815343 RepID=UPI001E507B6D|nr:LysR family transcriptional regulator [Nitrogeniibacter aestuarii]